MATSSLKLKMKFSTLSGVKTWSFGNINPQVESRHINQIANAMVENGSIYKYPPLELNEAYLEEVTRTPFTIS